MTADQKKPEQEKEMPQDLKHHRPEETDELAKSEHPADDFMDSKQLDRETHGKKKSE